MSRFVNPSTQHGGAAQIVVPEKVPAPAVDEAPLDDRQYARVNGEWVPVSAPAFAQFTSDGSTFATTHTSGEAMGSAGAQGTFVAPPSGVVLVTVAGQLRPTVLGQAAALSFDVQEGDVIGSGTAVFSHDLDKGLVNSNDQYIRASMPFLVTGLVPGSAYNTRTIGISESSSSEARIAHCSLTVIPQP